jgi:hypothetical protein
VGDLGIRAPTSARAGFTRLLAGPATFADIDSMLTDGSGASFVRLLVEECLILVER